MAEWNPNPSWTPKEQINGGQSFASMDDVSASDFNALIENMQYLYSEGGDFDVSNYPVGAVYISTVDTSPAILFGGSWTRITDKFLLAAGSAYAAGTRGGTATHKHNAGSHLRAPLALSSSHGGIMLKESQDSTQTFTAAQKIETTYTSANYVTSYSLGVFGYTEEATNLPPYEAFYMWKRTA